MTVRLRSAERLVCERGVGAVPMGSFAFERHYRVKELAGLWGLSARTVSRIFAEEADVIRVANHGAGRRKYATLSIPESVAARVHEKLRNQTLQENRQYDRPVSIIRLRDVDANAAGTLRTLIKLKSSPTSNRSQTFP